jgi:hypothetical protein
MFCTYKRNPSKKRLEIPTNSAPIPELWNQRSAIRVPFILFIVFAASADNTPKTHGVSKEKMLQDLLQN